MNSPLRRLLAVSGTVALVHDTACYAYVAAPTTTPSAGAEVRVSLTREGTTDLAQYLGPRVISLDGKVSSVSADGVMMIAASSVQIVDGARQRWNGEGAVAVPSKYVTGIQLRTIDRRKTTIAGATIAAVLVTAGIIFMRGGSGGSTETGPGTGVFIIR